MNKKGASLGDLYPAVLTIVLIGIILGIGIFILTETSKAISSTTITVNNESGIDSTTTTAVSKADDCGFSNFAVTAVDNGTLSIPSTAYTTDADLGTIIATGTTYNSSDWNVSYTYDGGDTSTTGYCGVLETSASGIGGFASWIAVIVVVLAAAVVLGIVLSSFGRDNAV